MKKRLWMIMACVLLLVLPMAGCSDDGEVQYLDETFLRELYGDEWVTEETQETSESIPESTAEETAESTEESTDVVLHTFLTVAAHGSGQPLQHTALIRNIVAYLQTDDGHQ